MNLIDRHFSDGNEIEPCDWPLILSNFSLLTKKVVVWPEPMEQFRTGSKVNCQLELDIATKSIGMSRPASVVVPEDVLEDVARSILNKKILGVLKRDFSADGDHVYGSFKPFTMDQFSKAVADTHKDWEAVRDVFGVPQWVLQPLLTFLSKAGEIRTFICDGILITSMVTMPREDLDMWVQPTDRVTPLKKFM